MAAVQKDGLVQGPAIPLPPLKMVGLLYLFGIVKLVQTHKLRHRLKSGPAGAKDRARYATLVASTRTMHESMLAARGGGTSPESYYLRVMPGDPEYAAWKKCYRVCLDDLLRTFLMHGCSMQDAIRLRDELDPAPPL